MNIFVWMQKKDGMIADGIYRKAVIALLFMPFLLVGFHCVSASPEMTEPTSSHVSVSDSVLVAGVFQYIDVSVPQGAEKVCILVFKGASIPEYDVRSPRTFYQWEYDQGVWRDTSGYVSSSLDPSKCYEKNDTFSFYVEISRDADPGNWTVKVLVDNEEVSSVSLHVIIGDFCLFFSTIISVYEHPLKQRNELLCSDTRYYLREEHLRVGERNIERAVDVVLKEKKVLSHEETAWSQSASFYGPEKNLGYKQESVKSTVCLYPRSRLKDDLSFENTSGSFMKIRGGGNGFSLMKCESGKRLLIWFVLWLMISASLFPVMVFLGETNDARGITILNIQSYPLVGKNWTVLFTTVGCANLTISTVNGTTWSNSDLDNDLLFFQCRKGNEIMEYEWVNNSVFVPYFSSNETCYEISEVLQPGSHTLMFQFGDDVAFAKNLALESWLQTSTGDFDNGTKTNINVSSGSFLLSERWYHRNFTRINNQGFEGSWPPTGWSEDPVTSNWHQDSTRVHEGTYSAGFDGSGGPGGAKGNLTSVSMNCSGSNVTAIYVKFWAYSYRGSTDTYYLDYYDGSTWDQITRLDNFGVSSWTQYTQKITDSQYFISNFRIRWRVTGLQNNRNYYIDVVNVSVERNESGYYSTGNLISKAHDTTRNAPDYNKISVNRTTPSGTTMTSWIRTADTQTNLSSATWYSNVTQAPKKRWVQWRINLTGNTYLTPTVNEVNLTWIYDNEAPRSNVTTISPYWQNTSPFTILASASDNGSGIKEVALYYNFSATNASGWSGWTLFGVNDTTTTSSYTWSFTTPKGDGYYRFYTRAIDNELNIESPPSSPGFDTLCGVDTVKPSSQVDMIFKYWHNVTTNPLVITVTNTNENTSGIKNITLFYQYRPNNVSSWGSWVSFGTNQAAPWSWNFSFPNGEGHYRFYSIACDNARNREDPPTSPAYDTQCGYDTSKPSSQVDYISPYAITFTPLPMSSTASDDVKSVTLFFYYSSRNSTWWNPNWQYRKQLSISGKNGGYQMKIVIGNSSGGNVNCNGHARSNFGDIRFISFSDNSTQLSYWLKNYTAGVQATFYVNNSRNDSSIWLYYGNRNASATSSGDATFYFFDDFSNGLSKWVMDSWNTDSIFVNQTMGNPSPSLKHLPDNSIPANRTYQDTRIRTATYQMQNGTIEYDVYLAGIPRVIHQFGWRVNSLSWTNGYCWRLQTANGDGGFFRYTAPATWTQIGTSFPNAAGSTWYHVQVNISGSNYATLVNPPCGGASTRTVTDSTKLTADYLVSQVHGVSMDSTNYVLVDNIFVRKYRATPPTWSSFGSEEQGYIRWNNASNPDLSLPWSWNFSFPNGFGYYWFYSIAVDVDGNKEDTPDAADAQCYFTLGIAPVINNYDLRNGSGSKLDNLTGLLDVNKEYYFTVNVTSKYGWVYLDYIDITAWYDQGSDATSYNQTAGGNLNMFLRYENVTGNASFQLLWPKKEVQLILTNCTQTIINSTTRIVKISFKPLNQTRWACSNNTWSTTKNTTNDPYSWNFNITAIDKSGLQSWTHDEYGVYKFAMILPEDNWVDVRAPPGYNATTNIVNVTYSSNYDFNISIYFEENLTNISSGDTIPIAHNVYICANADPADDIIIDMMFNGIGAINAVDIINTSGVFHRNNTSQVVFVQFNVYIPFGTIHGEYSAHVATKIRQKE
jgi:hypothetical protein